MTNSRERRPENDDDALAITRETIDKMRTYVREESYDDAIALASATLEARARVEARDDGALASMYALYGEALFRSGQREEGVLGPNVRANDDGERERGDDGVHDESAEEEAGAEEEEGASGASGEDDGDGDEDDDDGEEEETDMELGWKMLEMARVLYEKSDDDRLALADVLELLGEVNAEQSQFEAALGDYNAALRLLEAELDPTDRRLASVLFAISMAHQLSVDNDNDAALAANARALAICEARIADCKAGDARVSKGASERAGELMSPEATIRELEEIMGVAADLKERQEELKELVSADNSTRQALKQVFMTVGGGGASSAATAPAVEESAGFAAPRLTSHLPVQAAPVRKVQAAPVRVEPAPVKRVEPAPVKRVEPCAENENDTKKLKPTAAATEAEPNGCPQQ